MAQLAGDDTDPDRAERKRFVLARAYARLASTAMQALPSRSVRWLLACGILLVAVIIGVTTLIIFHFRDRAIASNERQLQNAAVMVAWHVDQEFQQLELVQERIIDVVRGRGIKTEEEFERELSSITTTRSSSGIGSDAAAAAICAITTLRSAFSSLRRIDQMRAR